ncbi:unnamed protein product [Pleuronectes platessa]|uniref:Uncharacterized protein n=1 Tax=Pleuronectes platessa TaxID=8262 RepID=A0A9N7VP00_PLEPL|nr:unnamed protein product [Pleuronectes platessa]
MVDFTVGEKTEKDGATAEVRGEGRRRETGGGGGGGGGGGEDEVRSEKRKWRLEEEEEEREGALHPQQTEPQGERRRVKPISSACVVLAQWVTTQTQPGNSLTITPSTLVMIWKEVKRPDVVLMRSDGRLTAGSHGAASSSVHMELEEEATGGAGYTPPITHSCVCERGLDRCTSISTT